MEPQLLKKLEKLGLLVPLRTGARGVPVSLQYQQGLTEPSRATRGKALRAIFEQVAQSIQPWDAEIDLNSISVSAQTVEAILPVDRYDELLSDLGKRHVRVDLMIDRQIV